MNGTGLIPSMERSECGQTELQATLEEQNLTSPGYPYTYSHNLDCAWNIGHPRNYSILITVTNMVLESHPHCSYDYVDFIQCLHFLLDFLFSDCSYKDLFQLPIPVLALHRTHRTTICVIRTCVHHSMDHVADHTVDGCHLDHKYSIGRHLLKSDFIRMHPIILPDSH